MPGPVITWEGKSKLTQGNVYEIKSVNISDVGVYICSAKSGTKVTKAYAFLSVNGQHGEKKIKFSKTINQNNLL